MIKSTKRLFWMVVFSMILSPLGLAATVTIAWDRNGDGVTAGYNVYRSTTSGGPYTKVNLMLIPEPSDPNMTPQYMDTLPAGSTITYFYVVRAANSGGTESANSVEVAAFPPPKVPTNPRIVSFSSAQLQVDGITVASGPPFPVVFVLPRQTPPRQVPLRVTVTP